MSFILKILLVILIIVAIVGLGALVDKLSDKIYEIIQKKLKK